MLEQERTMATVHLTEPIPDSSGDSLAQGFAESRAAADCPELQQLQVQVARASRAFLEQQERINGSFASFAEARSAINFADALEQDLQQARRIMLQHRLQHHCA
jgi:hypothetical protein